jgi:hypothetical protein
MKQNESSSEIDCFYGLEEYYKYIRRYNISSFIHELINLTILEDPYPTLKRLLVQAHNLKSEEWVYTKSVTFFLKLLKKEYSLVDLASVARNYFENEKLFRIIHAYERSGNDLQGIADGLSRGQVKSKIWLIKELIPIKKHFDNILVLAGWFGQFKMLYANRCTYKKMRIIDIDKNNCKIGDEIFNNQDLQDYKVKSICGDINNLVCHKNGYEFEIENFKTESSYKEKYLPNLIINTSSEHMTEEWFFQLKSKKLESNPLVAIQSNNLFDIPEHINCVYSINHMKKKFPMTEILFEGELQLKGYKRVMLIGRP